MKTNVHLHPCRNTYLLAHMADTRTQDEILNSMLPQIDWQSLVRGTGGKFDVGILRRHYNIYGLNEGPMTEPQQIHGLREWFTTHMRTLRMTTSVATNNSVRYRWLCQHYFVEERMNADPTHYHVFPFRQFYSAPRFYAYFFASFFAFLDKPCVKFVLALILMFKMHTWSHELYMIPIPMLKMAYPCSELPPSPCVKFSTLYSATRSRESWI